MTVPVIDQAHHGFTDALSCYAHFLLFSIFRKYLLTLLNWSTITFPFYVNNLYVYILVNLPPRLAGDFFRNKSFI